MGGGLENDELGVGYGMGRERGPSRLSLKFI
jgi:hypothetical protein